MAAVGADDGNMESGIRIVSFYRDLEKPAIGPVGRLLFADLSNSRLIGSREAAGLLPPLDGRLRNAKQFTQLCLSEAEDGLPDVSRRGHNRVYTRILSSMTIPILAW